MNLDSFKSLKEIELNELDVENIGSWPFPIKVIAAAFVALVVLFTSYQVLVSDEIDGYEQALQKEQELRQIFKAKYARASMLDVYKQQMVEMEEKFAQLLKKLPTSNETPGLLDDLSYVGTTSGLVFNKLRWLPEVEQEFYTELPISIEVVGGYHEFGEFVSKVAVLPRIVSLHDFSIDTNPDGKLTFNVVAKTYRYEGIK